MRECDLREDGACPALAAGAALVQGPRHRRHARSPCSRDRAVLVGAIAFYVERTVLGEGFEEIATELIQSDEIRDQVAATPRAAVRERRRRAGDRRAASRGAAGRSRRSSRGSRGRGREAAAARLLERPRLQTAWVRTATATQQQVVRLLDDEGRVRLDDRRPGDSRSAPDHPRARRRDGDCRHASPSGCLPTRSAGSRSSTSEAPRDRADGRALLRFLATGCGSSPSSSPRSRSGSPGAADGSSSGRSRSALVVVGVLVLLIRRVAGAYLVDELTTDATGPAGDRTCGASSRRAWRIAPGSADRARPAPARRDVWLVGSTGLAARARRLVAPVAENPLWTYAAVAGLVVVAGSARPAVPARVGLVPRLRRAARVGVEVLRRFVRAEHGDAGLTPRGHRCRDNRRRARRRDRPHLGGRRGDARRVPRRSLRSRVPRPRCDADEVPIAVAYLSGTLPHAPIGVGWAALRELPGTVVRATDARAPRGRRGPAAHRRGARDRARRRSVGASSRRSSRARPSPSSGSCARSCTASCGRARSRAWSRTRSRGPRGVQVADGAARAHARGRPRPRRERGARGRARRARALPARGPPAAQADARADRPTSPSEALARVGAAAVEWKLDGARLQVHRRRRRRARLHAQPRRRHRPRARGRRGGPRAAGRRPSSSTARRSRSGRTAARSRSR